VNEYRDLVERIGSGATCPHGWNPRYCTECGDPLFLRTQVKALERALFRMFDLHGCPPELEAFAKARPASRSAL
jgi:hypothetical protein